MELEEFAQVATQEQEIQEEFVIVQSEPMPTDPPPVVCNALPLVAQFVRPILVLPVNFLGSTQAARATALTRPSYQAVFVLTAQPTAVYATAVDATRVLLRSSYSTQRATLLVH